MSSPTRFVVFPCNFTFGCLKREILKISKNSKKVIKILKNRALSTPVYHHEQQGHSCHEHPKSIIFHTKVP